MIGICLRESVGNMLISTLTNLPVLSNVEISIYSRIVSVLAMKQRFRATGKRIWTSALTPPPVMESAISGPKVVMVMDLIRTMDLGFNEWSISGYDVASVRHAGGIRHILMGFMQNGQRKSISSTSLPHTIFVSSLALPMLLLLRTSLPLAHSLPDLP